METSKLLFFILNKACHSNVRVKEFLKKKVYLAHNEGKNNV